MKQGKIYISKGNIKLKNILIFNLPAIKTCINCTTLCSKKCYARKAERLYPSVLPCRERNLELSKQENFAQIMITEINNIMRRSKKPFHYFRWHESGDIYSRDYLNKIITICKAIPELKFLMFTKSFHLFKGIEIPSNLKVVWSVWTDTKQDQIPKQGSFSYAGDCIPHNKTSEIFECTGFCSDCLVCWHLKDGQSAHFKIH